MALDNVTIQIGADAQRRVDSLLNDARAQSTSILDNARKEVEQYKQEASSRKDILLEAMERKMLAQARFDAQRLLMNTKRDMIEQVREAVREKVLGLPRPAREKFLKGLVSKAKKEISVATVYCSKSDKSLLKSSSYTVKEGNMSGGIIAETKDGSVSVNLTVDELVTDASAQTLVELSGVLFGNA